MRSILLPGRTIMDEISKEYVISFFDKRLLQHGDRPEAVGRSSKGQMLRYQAMLDAGNVNNNKILEKLIVLARQKYPQVDFRVFDIDKDILDEDFDYIFLCGVFNLKMEGIDETVKKTLLTLFKHCRTALAFNALSSHDPIKDFELHYVSPEELLDFTLKNLSPHVSFRHDRIPYDFTMFVYTDDNSQLHG